MFFDDSLFFGKLEIIYTTSTCLSITVIAPDMKQLCYFPAEIFCQYSQLPFFEKKARTDCSKSASSDKYLAFNTYA